MSPTLQQVFNKFAGQEVQMICGRSGEMIIRDDDPVIADIQKEAENYGWSLRTWTPDSFGTCDYRTDRLNVFVEEEADGKWRVQPRFELG